MALPIFSRYITFLVLLIVFSFTKNIVAQEVLNDTLIASQYYQKADSLLTSRKTDKSIVLFQKALPLYEKAKAWERVASCYNKVSEIQCKPNTLEKSLQYAKKAIKICNTYLTKNHPEEANAYDNIGLYHKKKTAHKSSLLYFEKALTLRKKIFPEYHLDIAKSYINIALFNYYTEKHQNAITYFEKGLAIYLKILDDHHPNIGNIYNELGNIYDVLGKPDIALSFYKKSLSIIIKGRGKNHLHTGYSYLNMGVTYDKIKQLNLALEYYEKALSIFKKENNIYALGVVYLNIGVVFDGRGETDKALQYFKESLSLTQKLYGDDHPETAGIYSNLGMIYKDFDMEKSLFYYTRALQVFKKAYGESHSYVASIYNSLGSLYKKKKEYDTSLQYFQESLKILLGIFDENHIDIAESYRNIGGVHYEKEAYTIALDYYQKSLDILQNTTEQHFDFIIDCYVDMGKTYSKQQDYKLGLAYFEKAIHYNLKNNNDNVIKNTFDPKHYNILDKLFETFFWKAKTLKYRYKRDKTLEDLEQSIVLYQNSDLLVDHFRQSYRNFKDKVNLARKAKDMYTDAIISQLLKYDITKNHTMLEKAHYYAGKSKSNILKDLLLANDAKNFSGLPQEITMLENTLRSNRAFYQSKIVSQKSNDSIDIVSIKEYENKLFDVNRRQDSLTQIVEQDYPKYYQLKHQNTAISVAEIQDKLNKNTTLLEFFTTDSITYAFTISKNKLSVKELPTPKLTEKVNAFREAIITRDLKTYKELGNELYTSLIQPLKKDLTGDELIIIPDESLWHLNFELLLTKDDISKAPGELSYLLRDYAVTYANSASLLFNRLQNKNKKEEQEVCLAFSFSDSIKTAESKNMSLATVRDAGDDLPGTRKEIKAISEMVDGQYYFGIDADEATFKKEASKYKILHLALHGEVDNERPENSKLYFTKGKDTIEDNLLYSHELFALDIPAELTVLSACNTGTGKIAKGEGIMSLGNAFQYAGTKSLLLSSWEVSDKTTPQLMQFFYANLKDGMNKSKALQQAKLQYISKADIYKTAPFYWGGFYLVGDTAPIDFGTNYLWWWAFGLGLLIFFIVAVYLYKKSNRLAA